MIYLNWLPAAIRYGIPYETFWNINPKIMDIYQSEYIQHEETRIEMIDYTAWLHGAYILNAVQSALNPKKVKYPKSPINVKEKETPLSETEKFKLWVMEFNKRFEKNSNQCPNV